MWNWVYSWVWVWGTCCLGDDETSSLSCNPANHVFRQQRRDVRKSSNLFVMWTEKSFIAALWFFAIWKEKGRIGPNKGGLFVMCKKSVKHSTINIFSADRCKAMVTCLAKVLNTCQPVIDFQVASSNRHGICQKFYTVGFSGQKFYTINFTQFQQF